MASNTIAFNKVAGMFPHQQPSEVIYNGLILIYRTNNFKHKEP